MRVIAVLLCVVAAASAAKTVEVKRPIEIDDGTRQKLQEAIKELDAGNKNILDDLPNMIFDLIASVIGNADFDPFDLPDLEIAFEHRPNWITYHGDFSLTNGEVGGFSDIARNGDAEVSISLIQRTANMRIPISFEALSIRYDYSIRFMGLGPNGLFVGSFEGITAVLDIDINLVGFDMVLNDFSLEAERFVFRFEGNPLSDWLANIMMNVVAEFVREPIMSAVEAVFTIILNAIFGAIGGEPTIMLEYLY